MITKSNYGSIGEKEVTLVTIKEGIYKVSVMTLGATLIYYGTDRYNAVIAHPSFEGYLNDPSHAGQVVGPYANRVGGASFLLDGVRYNLDKNDRGKNNLHSGSANYGEKIWSIACGGENSVTFLLKTPQEGGWPGEHKTMCTYMLTDDGTLTIKYSSFSTKKCPVALTNHAYFILDSHGSKETEIEIPADYYVDVDDYLIPFKDNPRSVDNTPFDFRRLTKIGERRNGEYDNTWVLLDNATIHAKGDKAELWCKTTEPGIQMYTGGYLSGDFKPFYGLALETGRFPDSPNRPDFPGEYTDNNKRFESVTCYKLKVFEA